MKQRLDEQYVIFERLKPIGFDIFFENLQIINRNERRKCIGLLPEQRKTREYVFCSSI